MEKPWDMDAILNDLGEDVTVLKKGKWVKPREVKIKQVMDDYPPEGKPENKAVVKQEMKTEKLPGFQDREAVKKEDVQRSQEEEAVQKEDIHNSHGREAVVKEIKKSMDILDFKGKDVKNYEDIEGVVEEEFYVVNKETKLDMKKSVDTGKEEINNDMKNTCWAKVSHKNASQNVQDKTKTMLCKKEIDIQVCQIASKDSYLCQQEKAFKNEMQTKQKELDKKKAELDVSNQENNDLKELLSKQQIRNRQLQEEQKNRQAVIEQLMLKDQRDWEEQQQQAKKGNKNKYSNIQDHLGRQSSLPPLSEEEGQIEGELHNKEKSLQEEQLRKQFIKGHDQLDDVVKKNPKYSQHLSVHQLGQYQLREHQTKEQLLREDKMRAHQLREQQLRGQQLREQQLKKQQLRDQQLKEQQLREQQLREQQLRELQLREKQLRELHLIDQQFREQRLGEQQLRENQPGEQQLKWREQQIRKQLQKEQQEREHWLREQKQQNQNERDKLEKEQVLIPPQLGAGACLASSHSPGHSRLVERLLARGQLPGLSWADCSRLVLQLRAGRGGLSGLHMAVIEGEVGRLAREEECPVCLDPMGGGGTPVARLHCGHTFHTR